MNTHMILGTVIKKPRIIKAENKNPFAIMELAEETNFNEDRETKWRILKYGEPKQLERFAETMSQGDAVLVQGTGFFNRAGYYNVIAQEIWSLETKPEQKTDRPETRLPEEVSELCRFLDEEMFKEGENEA